MASNHEWIILIRGINVGGVKVLMADLKKLLEALGMKHVKTLLASGNVFVESEIADAATVKKEIEAALEAHYARKLRVLVLPHSEIVAMVEAKPFEQETVTKDTRLYVTFLGSKPKGRLEVPWESEDGSLRILKDEDSALLSVLDLGKGRSVDAMAIIEKTYGSDVTTRNWNTVEKIAAMGGEVM